MGNIPPALPSLGISQTAHHLLSLPDTFLQASRASNLQQRRHAADLNALLLSGLPIQLYQPGQLIQESLRRLNHPAHSHKLCPDDWVLHQLLPERLARASMVPRILCTHAAQSDARRRDGSALRVEIRHDDLEATAFLVYEVRNGHTNVLECDERAARRSDS